MNGVKNSGVQQYFRNKNFRQSSASVYGAESLKVSNLNTIKESEENIERTASDVFTSEDDEGKTASDIKELKKFRQDNYFECHSAAAKLKNLEDHRCVYRFYLNERLFPVPISADYNNMIRCTECHLPLEGDKHINGTIQAKVKINGQLQDIMLMLPARKSLIIQERRKEKVERREDDPLYFGIVRLGYGDPVFRSYPSDSLALRYQKGYQDLMNRRKYEYERVKEEEVLVI
ncbi:uncharacterized protein LOC121728195 [Aricia agestis]|uniref:uncharacterized protein LOC121728195 n=1 Tax=Aricia agestis TaxID=91739 RepID=UPI001C205E44|nr:uncharacterized protein LOC121728195 [Aricia agestis]